MRRFIILSFALFFICTIETNAQSESKYTRNYKTSNKAYDANVVRVTANEVFQICRAGRGLLIHAGDDGRNYMKKHIRGAYWVPWEQIRKGKSVRFPNFPRERIELFIYCY